MGDSRFVSYSDSEKEIVRQGIGAVRSVLTGNDEDAKLRLLFCLDWFMDPYYGQDISDFKDELITLLQEIVVSDKSIHLRKMLLNCWILIARDRFRCSKQTLSIWMKRFFPRLNIRLIFIGSRK